MPKQQKLEHGKRFSYYFTQDFPQEMLDWLNSQSDRNLAFTYALDRLYQEFGHQDLAEILPRNYEPNKHGHAAVGNIQKRDEIKPVSKDNATETPIDKQPNSPGTLEEDPSTDQAVKRQGETEDHQDGSNDIEPKENPKDAPPKKNKQWGTLNNLDGDPYA